MNSGELLKKINQVCTDAQKEQLSPEDLQGNIEDGWGGNSDDAFYGGSNEGQAYIGTKILKLIKEFSSKPKQGMYDETPKIQIGKISICEAEIPPNECVWIDDNEEDAGTFLKDSLYHVLKAYYDKNL